MSVFNSAIEGLKRYADFKGRSSREEFWSFLGLCIVIQAVAGFVGLILGVGPLLSGLVGALLVIPQLSVAVRRLHDVNRSGMELVFPCLMLLALPLAFAFRGILPQIVALGFLGMTLLVFANLLRLFLRPGNSVPNRFGGAPTAFTYA